MKEGWLNGLNISEKGNYVLDGRAICMVTHTTRPNSSGNARGRSVHLTIDGKKSTCNMIVEHYFQYTEWTNKKFCKICFKQYI